MFISENKLDRSFPDAQSQINNYQFTPSENTKTIKDVVNCSLLEKIGNIARRLNFETDSEQLVLSWYYSRINGVYYFFIDFQNLIKSFLSRIINYYESDSKEI